MPTLETPRPSSRPGPSPRARGERRRPALRGPRAFEEPRRSWVAWPIATALTLLLLALVSGTLAVVREEPSAAREPRAREAPPEAIVYVPAPPLPAEQSAVAPPVPGATAPERAPGAPGAPSPAARRPAVPADSTVRGTVPGRAPGALPPSGAAAGVRIETPREVFAPKPCDLACEIRKAEGAGRTAGINAPLTASQRDSIRRVVARRVQSGVMGRSSEPRVPDPEDVAREGLGLPPRQKGVSLPIGLPGGGPSAAQRRRDSTLNADVAPRLARIKARADSIEAARRDSLLKARKQ